MARKYYKGDDFGAFGQVWAEVVVDIPEDWVVTKAELRVGNLPKMTFINPVFPFPVALDASQSANLKDVNTCHLAIYDEEDRKLTLEGSWTFIAENEVV